MTLNNQNTNGANKAAINGTVGIPAGANIIIPQNIIDFCYRAYPPHLGSAYDTERAHLIAKRLVVEGHAPLPCDIATFIASPAFTQLKQQTQTVPPTTPKIEKITPTTATSPTNVDSQPHPKISDPLQSPTHPLQTATDPLQSAPKPQQTATHPQQSATNTKTPPSRWAAILDSISAHRPLTSEDLQRLSQDYTELLSSARRVEA